MQMRSLIILILVGVFTSPFIGAAINNSVDSTQKDTLYGYVLYGENYGAESLDSIEHQFYEKNLTKEDVIHLIDSLFDLDEVPYSLVNELNTYIAILHNRKQPLHSHFSDYIDETGLPAAVLYRTWNTQTPFSYDQSITEHDTILTLNLTDSIFNCHFHPPLLDKPNNEYHGIVTSKYGWRDGKKHQGIDLNLSRGDKIYNVFPGVVRMAKYYQGYGNVVIVRHFNGLETLYAHLYKIKVKPGQEVEAGEIVGLGGSTGNSTGNHLHMETRFKGVSVNPAHIICFEYKELQAQELVFKKTKDGFVCFPKGAVTHTVQRGDYVYKVASRYGVTVKQLCELNSITSKTRLSVGQELRISVN